MEAKDKAKELVDRFTEHTTQEHNWREEAKQCALICVDEMILQLDKGRSISVDVYLNQRRNLIEVKQRINEL